MGEIRDGVRGFGKGSILCRVCGGDCECCEGREDVWLVRDFLGFNLYLHLLYRELDHTAAECIDSLQFPRHHRETPQVFVY